MPYGNLYVPNSGVCVTAVTHSVDAESAVFDRLERRPSWVSKQCPSLDLLFCAGSIVVRSPSGQSSNSSGSFARLIDLYSYTHPGSRVYRAAALGLCNDSQSEIICM